MHADFGRWLTNTQPDLKCLWPQDQLLLYSLDKTLQAIKSPSSFRVRLPAVEGEPVVLDCPEL